MSNERFGENRYAKMGLLTGLNYAAQGIGSIIISPLIKRLPTRYVLCAAVILFSIVSAMILIVDAATGGVVKFKTTDNTTHYGTWNPNGEQVEGLMIKLHLRPSTSPLSHFHPFWCLLWHGGAHPESHSERHRRRRSH